MTGDDAAKTASATVPETIIFANKFFAALKNTVFIRDEFSNDTLLRVPLDETSAELPIDGIKRELKLEETDPDFVMLDLVKQALDFVPAVRIGDPIPSEMRTGKASWEITDAHKTAARTRLSLQLVSWMSGDEGVVHDRSQLEMIAEDPAMRAKINTAFTEAAQKLGFESDEKEEVIKLVDQLADELAYIEALRDQFNYAAVIEDRLSDLAQIYRSDRDISETLLQVRKLCKIPMKAFREKFDDVDAQTGEIIAVLKNIDAQILFIQKNRDELYMRLAVWMDLANRWNDQPARRSRHSETLMEATYQFLAQRFLPLKEWELFSKSQEANKKGASETVW